MIKRRRPEILLTYEPELHILSERTRIGTVSFGGSQPQLGGRKTLGKAIRQ